MARIAFPTAMLCGAALLAACGRPEPEPVVVAPPPPAPIYGKDGTIIEQPVVTNQSTVPAATVGTAPAGTVVTDEPVETLPAS